MLDNKYITDNNKLKEIYPNCVFMGQNMIAKDAVIKHSVIENCKVEQGVVISHHNLKNCVIFSKTQIGGFVNVFNKNMLKTSSVRGCFNENGFDEDFIKNFARAICFKRPIKIVCGQDTRDNSIAIAKIFIEELKLCGATVFNAGIIPTPEISFLIKHYKANFGVMITASHNPSEYNGLKIFNQFGEYLTEEEQQEIIENLKNNNQELQEEGKVVNIKTAKKKYFNNLLNYDENRFDEIKVVIDCANGCAGGFVPLLFQELHCEVIAINTKGKINERCGSEHIENLMMAVLKNKADIGFAFDGDADRVIAVNNKGQYLDGDDILYLLAWHFKNPNNKDFNVVVGTQMTNQGIENKLKSLNLQLLREQVGGVNVAKKMKDNNVFLGSESSGHIFIGSNGYFSDAILTSRILMTIIKENSHIFNVVKENKYVQSMRNISLKTNLEDDFFEKEEFKNLVNFFNLKLKNFGRVLIRKSNTENKIRIMVESMDRNTSNFFATEIKKRILMLIES